MNRELTLSPIHNSFLTGGTNPKSRVRVSVGGDNKSRANPMPDNCERGSLQAEILLRKLPIEDRVPPFWEGVTGKWGELREYLPQCTVTKRRDPAHGKNWYFGFP